MGLVGLALGGAAAPARAAEWLRLGSRAIPRGTSASPDAPVVGLAYGPRASSRLGADVAVATWRSDARTLRLGLSALVGFDDAVSHLPLAGETGRTASELGLAWSFDTWAARRLGPRGLFELAATLGRRTAFTSERYVFGDPYRTDDVPFGGGGTYVGGDALARRGLGAAWDATLRLGLRAYLNALADAVGQREASDVIADFLHEGAAWQTSLELGLDRRFTERARAVGALYAEAIGPHDDTAKHLWLARLELGAAFASSALELAPFIDLEAGHGPSLLVNRTELRLAAGVKLYAR
jgi:hypothetical protein